MTRPEPINCYRCGQPGYVNWIDVSTLGEGRGTRYVPGESYCVTPGCADEDGSRRLVALTPQDLQHRADAAFMRRHKTLAEDR